MESNFHERLAQSGLRKAIEEMGKFAGFL